MNTSRREFLNDTGKLLAGTALAGAVSSPLIISGKENSPGEKINVALIGARGMGFGILQHAIRQPGVECIAICDIDDEVLNRRIADTEKIQGKKPSAYKDFRKVLENKDIDAVIIGTPDHWHCLMMMLACEAGKDVYVEKPMANSIGECDAMVKAARKYNRVVQAGQQQRSGQHWKNAMDFMKAGKIGQLRKVNIWQNFSYGVGQPKVADEPIPAGVDFNMWLGPAPERSFNKTRFHGSWRMFWDYGGGLMTDWGVHLLDMALWAKDITQTPQAVMSAGGNYSFPNNARETFDTMDVSYQLPGYTINLEFTSGIQSGPYNRVYGLAFIGNDATLVINRDGWEIFPEAENGAYKVAPFPKQPGKETHEEHVKNWIECIKTRKDPNCTVENGRLVALYAHAANIALRTGSRLEWNEVNKNFGSNAAANALIMPAYRKPWVLPKV
ncbi:MAG: Gfo/Idh/MocA family oxidoreductase [Chitinophagaceae bacterium]|nr:Gfo/Idh/MocA family oxidoreductase [Chitinophagaceae bacterium]